MRARRFIMKKYELTKRERDVLEVLWSSQEPLHASDIPKLNSDLNISSVQVSLKNLIKKEYIHVADIAYSGTVLSRRYAPIVSQEDFLKDVITESIEKLDNKVSTKNIVAALLQEDENEKETIAELEKLLQERKKKLKDK